MQLREAEGAATETAKYRKEVREDHAMEDRQGQRCPSFGYFESRESKGAESEHWESERYFK